MQPGVGACDIHSQERKGEKVAVGVAEPTVPKPVEVDTQGGQAEVVRPCAVQVAGRRVVAEALKALN